MGDDRYFDVLNRTPSFQNGRSIDLWTEFYDVELDEDGHRVGGTVGGAEPIATNISQEAEINSASSSTSRLLP